MREITFGDITSIVDNSELGYREILMDVVADGKHWTCRWGHRPGAGCYIINDPEADFDSGGEPRICRDSVLSASVAKWIYDNRGKELPKAGTPVPVLSRDFAAAFLKAYGIPDDNWDTFNDFADNP